jgi:hypothetical protein
LKSLGKVGEKPFFMFHLQICGLQRCIILKAPPCDYKEQPELGIATLSDFKQEVNLRKFQPTDRVSNTAKKLLLRHNSEGSGMLYALLCCLCLFSLFCSH